MKQSSMLNTVSFGLLLPQGYFELFHRMLLVCKGIDRVEAPNYPSTVHWVSLEVELVLFFSLFSCNILQTTIKE
jgi:hypothetical protein